MKKKKRFSDWLFPTMSMLYVQIYVMPVVKIKDSKAHMTNIVYSMPGNPFIIIIDLINI